MQFEATTHANVSSMDSNFRRSVLLCTVCDDRFLPGALVMLWSMKKHIPDFDDYPIKIYCDNDISKLSESSRQAIREVAPQVIFDDVNQPAYREDEIKQEHHRQAYVTLEVFREEGYKKVCFFDVDMLCVADFSGIFSVSSPFAATTERARGKWLDYQGETRWSAITSINSGFFVLDGAECSLEIYDRLIKMCQRRKEVTYTLDQDIVNQHLKRRKIPLYRLPEAFNFRRWGGVEVKKEEDKSFGNNAILAANNKRNKIIHYSNYNRRKKPWEVDFPSDNVAYNMWAAERDELCHRHPQLGSLLYCRKKTQID
jgi:lipopolysaccharide biosynthesis glycosyltransferase